MTRLSVLFCVVFGTFFLFTVAQNLSGDFTEEPKDGAKCKWYEQDGGTGSGPRGFNIKCKVENQNIYECTYRGNPHNCGWYNNGNQRAFYKGLAKVAAKNQANACSQKELEIKKCKNTIFKRQPNQFILGSL